MDSSCLKLPTIKNHGLFTDCLSFTTHQCPKKSGHLLTTKNADLPEVITDEKPVTFIYLIGYLCFLPPHYW